MTDFTATISSVIKSLEVAGKIQIIDNIVTIPPPPSPQKPQAPDTKPKVVTDQKLQQMIISMLQHHSEPEDTIISDLIRQLNWGD